MRPISTRTTLSLLALTLSACGGSAPLMNADAPSKSGDPGAYAAPTTVAGAEDATAGAAGPMEAEESMDDGAADHVMPAPDAAPAATGAAPTKRKRIARGSGATRKADRDAIARRPGPTTIARQASGVKAGEWNDNANYKEFQRFLSTQDHLSFDHLDIRNRRFMVVRDTAGRGVPRCDITVVDKHQHEVTLRTTTSGRAILFPHAEGLHGATLFASTKCQGRTARASFTLDKGDDVVTLDLDRRRTLPKTRTIDIAFVLDTTGSMSEEIAAVKDTIRTVASVLDGGLVDVRIALVEYKDRTDQTLTKVYPFSRDLDGFSKKVASISATGGGDTPEDVNSGLNVALNRLGWSSSSVGKFAFLVGDAPPHLDYQGVTYSASARTASHAGIQLFTIAASGMDDLGQVVWRQLAQYTGGTNLFVLRGGAGPQSVGAGDPKSSCGGRQTAYSSGNLDQLIVGKIKTELAALDANPLRIAGLGMDEKAKPCDERIVMAQ